MSEKQSWKSCKHHLGDLERNIDTIAKANSQVRLMRAIIPESEKDKLFKKEGINQWYYCTHPELIKLEVYRQDGIPNKKEGYTSVAQLFHLDIPEDPSLDWFGSDKHYLESAIADGLRMCAHCKFYKKK